MMRLRPKGFPDWMNPNYSPSSCEPPGGRGGSSTPIPPPKKACGRVSIGQAVEMVLQRMASKEFSPETLRGVKQLMKAFYQLSGLGPSSLLTEVTRSVAGKVLTRLQEKYAPYTAWTYRGKLLGIFRTFAAEGLILENPFVPFEMPPSPKMLPGPVLEKEEVGRLMKAIRPDLPSGIRNRALLEVFYSTGMRISECARLGVDDADLGRGTVAIRGGKGGKDRVVPLGMEAIRWLKRYLKQVRPRWAGETGFLWVGQEGRPVQTIWIRRIIRRLGKRAGIEVPVTPNTLRRTCATHLLSAGASLQVVKELLGHSDLKTLSRYVSLRAREVKEAHGQTHPRP